jgi:hypothetical protein
MNLEQLADDFKMHQSVLDFNKGFINMVITEMLTGRENNGSSHSNIDSRK